MFFLWVYGFPLGLWFSFVFTVFLWVYSFLLGLWFPFGLMTLIWVYVVPIFLRVKV